MKILLVEGITDVNLVRYIYTTMSDENCFDDFEAKRKGKIITFGNSRHENLQIINLKGQNNLEVALNTMLKPMERKIKTIGILTDTDNDFEKSKEDVQTAIKNSQIDKDRFKYFLTPNDKDLGNLETLLLSTLDKENIPQLQCFDSYKKCLVKDINNIEQRAIDKHEVEAYIKFSEKPRQRNQAQFSFIDNGVDTGLWDLSKKEFKPIISFVKSIFTS